jgi:hypothetical protein
MRSRPLSALIAGVLAIAAGRPVEAQQEYSFEGERLLVTNLAGEVTVRGHDGSRIVVRVTPGGDDAELLDYKVKRSGRAEFHVVYPLERSLSYRYPRNGGRTSFRVGSWRDESDFLEELYSHVSGREKITVGGGSGLEAWADLEILVPRGVNTKIVLGVGRLEASDVQAALDLDTHSGAVAVTNVTGDTRIDTGSGSVVARTIRGDLIVDTGSGRVEVGDVEGDRVDIDTGSGRVTVERAKANKLRVDTGSGSVRTKEIHAGETLIDTGSGSVTLDLVALESGKHVVDSGSGGVTVTLPSDASARIIADTGSGGIDLDVPSATLRRASRNHIELEIGEGRATLRIDTGSGRVKIRTRG